MIAAVYCVHYGLQWFSWSLRSVKPLVDDIFIFYTATPSHGQTTNLVCPEYRAPLWDVARSLGAHWHDCGPFGWEGAHRDFAIAEVAKAGYDQALVVDADEIWDATHLDMFITQSKKLTARNIRVGMRHFWRSTKWVCDDGAMPVRMINLQREGGDGYYPLNGGKVFHMGYAQTPEIINYKIAIHGHRNEWRPDWYEKKFLAWQPGMGDVHPTCVDYWNPIIYNDDGTLEYLIGDNPLYGKDLIV